MVKPAANCRDCYMAIWVKGIGFIKLTAETWGGGGCYFICCLHLNR